MSDSSLSACRLAASECLDTVSSCVICSILFSPLSYKMSAGEGTERNLIKGGHVGIS